jgi:hypothetical protein
MQDIKDTLRESGEFLRDQERSIASRLAQLPAGNIRTKKKGAGVYFYLQYRRGRSVKTDYLGKTIPAGLREKLAERKRLEKELGRVRESLRLLREKPGRTTDLVDPLLAILRRLTEEKAWDAGLTLIGSWCFLLYQKYLPVEKYALKTDDLDILVPRPFQGKAFDLGKYLERLGFSRHFNADGSTYFAGNRMKIEFLAKEGREGRRPSHALTEMAIVPQELRYLDMLFAEPLILKVARGVRARVPAPADFLLHKLVIGTLPERRAKKEKDLRQAVYTAKYVMSDKPETDRLVRHWQDLPAKWKARIRKAIDEARDITPLEQGVLQRLKEILA